MMQVLLIDDDPVWRRVVGRLLGTMGFGVAGEASDGAAALEMLAELSPDLIVTDCQMPTMDGIAFARRLRARGDETPLIMVSGQDGEEVVSIALDAGVTCFLAKPVDARLFEQAVGIAMGWGVKAALH